MKEKKRRIKIKKEANEVGRDDILVAEGIVKEAFPGPKFMVELDNDHEIMAYISGKIRKHHIRILLGDRVQVEISPYDLDRGRIVYRYKRMVPSRAKALESLT